MNQPIPDVAYEEEICEQACREAAAHNSLTESQADDCDEGEHGCPFCPWRNPLNKPADGDRFILQDGRLIEVVSVNMQHCESPRILYEFVNWTRHDGGRKSYTRKLSQWSGLVDGAKVSQVGRKPVASIKQRDPDRYSELMRLFRMRQPITTLYTKSTQGE